MFYLFLIVGILVCLGGLALIFEDKIGRKTTPFGIGVLVLGLALIGYSFNTAQGQLFVMNMTASNSRANWLVIDNSGGETLRHWILKDGYVSSSEQSDGWQFYDDEGNLCYVSGDAYVQRINMDFDKFMLNYKQVYNIPAEQKPVGYDSQLISD